MCMRQRAIALAVTSAVASTAAIAAPTGVPEPSEVIGWLDVIERYGAVAVLSAWVIVAEVRHWRRDQRERETESRHTAANREAWEARHADAEKMAAAVTEVGRTVSLLFGRIGP